MIFGRRIKYFEFQSRHWVLYSPIGRGFEIYSTIWSSVAVEQRLWVIGKQGTRNGEQVTALANSKSIFLSVGRCSTVASCSLPVWLLLTLLPSDIAVFPIIRLGMHVMFRQGKCDIGVPRVVERATFCSNFRFWSIKFVAWCAWALSTYSWTAHECRSPIDGLLHSIVVWWLSSY